MRILALGFILASVILSGCARTYVSRPSDPLPARVADEVVYVVGDFGDPTGEFRDVARSMAKAIDDDARAGVPRPWILGLGDNLYLRGLPRPGVSDPRAFAWLAEIATSFSHCRYEDEATPVFVIPGNHDYDDDAVVAEREYGDITRWYYPEELGIEPLSQWHMVPGERGNEASSAELYERVYGSPRNLAAFMRPLVIPRESERLAVVALDSELVVDLLYYGHVAIADAYFEALRETIRAVAPEKWVVIATHHGVATRGGHRPFSVGRLILGPGWPQFPQTAQKFAAIPPVGFMATVGRWAVHHPQDFGAWVQRAYREKLMAVLEAEGVPLILSGHDHCLQLLRASESVCQVISGGGAKEDSVTGGKEMVSYHAGTGYFRLSVHQEALALEMTDRHGTLLYRHVLAKKPRPIPQDPEPAPDEPARKVPAAS